MDYAKRIFLTTEHPSSSYCQSVLVDRETGEAYGQADLIEIDGVYVAGAMIYQALEDVTSETIEE